jgi:hypothetical protein
MRRQQRKYSWVVLVAIALSIILILVLVFTFEPYSSEPIQISYSLEPEIVRENEPAKLVFRITNKNETDYKIKFLFTTESIIKIYAGTEELLLNNIYNFTIGAYERNQVREFTVLGSLEENIASSKYQIHLEVMVDQNIIPELARDIYLTINE